MEQVLAVLGLSVACALWVLVGRFVAQADPELGNRVETERGCCGKKGTGACAGGACASEPAGHAR